MVKKAYGIDSDTQHFIDSQNQHGARLQAVLVEKEEGKEISVNLLSHGVVVSRNTARQLGLKLAGNDVSIAKDQEKLATALVQHWFQPFFANVESIAGANKCRGREAFRLAAIDVLVSLISE